MIRLGAWIDRTWEFVLPAGAFPAVLERLRGTPARVEELFAGVSEPALRGRVGGAWSAKQHIGHLDDLDELDERRLREFLARVPTLSAADMTNKRTHDANHNDTPTDALALRFRTNRLALVRRMEALGAEEISAVATHPRLRQPVRLIDWAVFVAEHDDHHLASARHAIGMARAAGD